MSNTRYGHSNQGGGNQDQGERKDEGWTSRQGGSESNRPGRKGEPVQPDQPGDDRRGSPPPGTNTQGDLTGIREASHETGEKLARMWDRGFPDRGAAAREPAPDSKSTASGTDQPPRMGGPLGPDPENPHLPEGDQTSDTQGTGAGGYDRGVNATQVGAVHQGVKEEHHRAAG